MMVRTLLVTLCLLMSAFQLQAADPPPKPPELSLNNPGSELWREVRQRDGEVTGVTQVRSPGAEVLVNVSGQSWREYRMEQLIPTAASAIFIVLFMILMFRVLGGRINLSEGRSGMRILRFTNSQRAAHWTTAILFVTLAITGLVLLLGRNYLIPILGPQGFGVLASTAKFLHAYLGPLFVFALTWLFVLFVRGNMPSPRIDLQWVLKGGGLFGSHAHADRYNAGEKLWFWVASIGGLAVIVSGLVLDFPIFGQTRATMEFYHLIHSVAAVVLIVFAIGHIFMGTAALEATFEVMKTGYCDANWAKEHHDIWYEKVKDTAEPAPSEEEGAMATRHKAADNA